ncbi:nitrilase-related carbon-nitrogen hydrolase [Rhizobium sp. BR 314]|uniref:nitrilase-related carbon-nitrogen hydrolase n=1 Tax=Rhizobium sp. BR 314 TaxID=3040013 RepID=UPI0039BF95CD
MRTAQQLDRHLNGAMTPREAESARQAKTRGSIAEMKPDVSPSTSARSAFPWALWITVAAACLSAASAYWHGYRINLTPSESMGLWRRPGVHLSAAIGRSPASEEAWIFPLTVMLPEAALGFWTPTTERAWIAVLQGTELIVVAGSMVADLGGYDNVLIAISAARGAVIYRERMPVPESMWQPWCSWSGACESTYISLQTRSSPSAPIGSIR